MSKQKVKPDPGVLERQQARQRRHGAGRKLGAVAVAAAVAITGVIIAISVLGGETGPQTSNEPSTTSRAPIRTPSLSVGEFPKTDYLLDLNTGKMTPLPESIVGTQDRTSDYAVSLDGSRLAYAGPGNDGNRQIFIANLDGTGAHQVTHREGAGSPTWSPNGSSIAYLERRGDEVNVYELDLATGASTRITWDAGRMSASDDPPSFTPDGSSIVYTTHQGEIRIVPVAGYESRRLLGGDGVEVADGQLSPDGSLLSYFCGDPNYPWDRCLANADGTDARVLLRAVDDAIMGPRWSPDSSRIVYWELHGLDVIVLDVTTGDQTLVTQGASPVWVDDHTLIVKADRCAGPGSTGCGG